MSATPVSVIIPTFNRAHLILRAVCSVLLAMSIGDELIVVDDGSTDGTAALLEPYGDRIRYVRKKNGGVGSARNHGIRHARHPLIAFNDSDDEWHADKLALQRSFMDARPDVVYCFSNLGIRRDAGPTELHGLIGWHEDPRSWDEILGPATPYSDLASLPPGRGDFNVHIGDLRPAQLRRNHVATQTALVRRELAGDPPWFPEDIQLHEDMECFTRLAARGPVAYLDADTAWQWGHRGPRLSRVEDEEWLALRLKVLERAFGGDAEFMAQYGELYRRTVRADHVALARAMLANGHSLAARSELRLAGGGPLGYRVLAALPPTVLCGLMSARRALRRAGSRVQGRV